MVHLSAIVDSFALVREYYDELWTLSKFILLSFLLVFVWKLVFGGRPEGTPFSRYVFSRLTEIFTEFKQLFALMIVGAYLLFCLIGLLFFPAEEKIKAFKEISTVFAPLVGAIIGFYYGSKSFENNGEDNMVDSHLGPHPGGQIKIGLPPDGASPHKSGKSQIPKTPPKIK